MVVKFWLVEFGKCTYYDASHLQAGPERIDAKKKISVMFCPQFDLFF